MVIALCSHHCVELNTRHWLERRFRQCLDIGKFSKISAVKLLATRKNGIVLIFSQMKFQLWIVSWVATWVNPFLLFFMHLTFSYDFWLVLEEPEVLPGQVVRMALKASRLPTKNNLYFALLYF